MFYAKTDFCRNKVIDALLRAQALGAPATWYVGLLTCNKGIVARSTAYALNDTVAVQVNSNDGDTSYHLYKVTTAGTTAASAPTTYFGVKGEAIVDGTATLTEQTAALEAGTAQVEPSGGAYARVAVAASLANFAGTQSAGSTTASTGSTGTTSNNAQVNFPTSTAAWAAAPAMVWAQALYDAASAGNCWYWIPMLTPNNVGNGVQPFIAAAGMQVTEQ
ncbi:MAG: hypothetical protein KGI52_08430 [Burkholderiales bacterium]|nr:hypothetical protein [Burkholderiales bacterium]